MLITNQKHPGIIEPSYRATPRLTFSTGVMAEAFGAETIRIAYDRDDADRDGAAKAVERLQAAGLTAQVFDWDAPVGRNRFGDVLIPKTVRDLGDFSTEQINWLRQRGLM